GGGLGVVGFFFFKGKGRHRGLVSAGSSAVCSSDLSPAPDGPCQARQWRDCRTFRRSSQGCGGPAKYGRPRAPPLLRPRSRHGRQDRKSGVEGKGGELGGRGVE